MPTTLGIGSSGAEVSELQRQLTTLGYGSYLSSGVNGKFDAATQSAVAAFQKQSGISEKSNAGSLSTAKVGDAVTFLGGSVYVSSTATKASANRGQSKCSITYLAKSNRHPVHCVSSDGGKVYGWVDAVNVEFAGGGVICGPTTWEALRKAVNADYPVNEPSNTGNSNESYKEVVVTTIASDSSIFILNLITGTQINFLVRPEEVTDSVATNFEFETPRGRSVGYVGYLSTDNKTVSFVIPLHVDFVQESTLEATVNKLKALEYPNYSSGAVIPPNCYVNMFRGIRFTAVCTAVDVTWKGDIKNGGYTHADVSMTFRGVSDIPFTATQVESGGNSSG